MKNTLILLLSAAVLAGCVQKTYNKTVVYTLRVEGMKGIQSVGIRGTDKPLNWNADYTLTAVKPDSLYQATITYQTGYKFTEIKFVVNGQFELENAPNRRVVFSDTDTTRYSAVFNKNP